MFGAGTPQGELGSPHLVFLLLRNVLHGRNLLTEDGAVPLGVPALRLRGHSGLPSGSVWRRVCYLPLSWLPLLGTIE